MADIFQVIGGLSSIAIICFIIFLFFIWKPSSHIQTLRDRHVLITGGSSGIGLEIAKEALAEGSYITLIARNLSNLQRAVEEIILELQCDKKKINIKVADVRDYKAISEAINESFQWRPVDVLVCNAGVGSPAYLDQVSIDEIDNIVGTNLTGTLYTLRTALPLMKPSSYKHPKAVVLMGSHGSLYPIYGGGVYTSTKYALKGLAENLRLELLPYNFGVILVCPGFVETPLLNQMDDGFDDLKLAEITRKVTFYNRSKADNPRDIARDTLKGVKRGNSLVPCGLKGAFLAILSSGILPADSFGKAIFNMLAFVPARVVGYVLIGYVYAVIWLNHRTSIVLVQSEEKESCGD